GSGGACGAFQSRIYCLCHIDWHEDVVRKRLASPYQPAWSSSAVRLWGSDRPGFLTGRREWWVGFECRPDALRPANTAGSCHVGGHWRADYDRRDDWICVGGLAAPVCPASVVSRLRVFDRLGNYGAGVELCGFLRSTNGTSLVKAATR